MKIPYGESDFKKIRTGDYLYIDKTRYIQKLEEQGSFNILLRPRRFGKSLFLSTLRYYYDISYKDDFEVLFGGLFAGENPTPLRNSYQVLAFDFSGIATDDAETIRRNFTSRVENCLLAFLEQYNYGQDAAEEIRTKESPQEKIDSLFRVCSRQKLYLLIDEYDHFANAILGNSLELFTRIVGKGGFVRAFYETIKIATGQGAVDRLFITGVTSITLDSMTSGFNIGKNLSFEKAFNQSMGFTHDETMLAVQPLADLCEFDAQKITEDIAQWYNGYQFSSRAEEKIFNPDMVLYYIDRFNIEDCCPPEQMLDGNIASDYGKIMQLFSIGDPEANFRILEELIVHGQIMGQHKHKLDPDVNKPFERDDFISLLLYMGFITISGRVLDQLRYNVPNHVISRLYFQYFKKEIEQRAQINLDSRLLAEAVRQLALHNNIAPLTEEISKVLALFSNRDFMRMDEKHIKAVILTLLYQSEIYFIRSEAEVNNRYPDILLLERSPFEVPNQFLFELKFCKKKDGKKGWEQKKEEGVRQVLEYLELKDVRCLDKLKAYLLLTDGTKIEAVPFKGANYVTMV
ncbi:PD-(D/E)XK nuclease superfamily protein [Candidatus Electrothrix marina]|uniref:PD-(D/E)XK nuclease superfamily protein n=1 Tax=Candidatus Electrothrix marina TaxID=1859130 RepID=A0A444JGJ2_9BACT|nr:PD-(D/E)XK nuclease superfamily protein [Candidatus Electrothrix marina]